MNATGDTWIDSVFQPLAERLNAMNEKRERLVKASRDITQQSKKAIFLLHRVTDEYPHKICSDASEQLAIIREQMRTRLLPELSAEEYHKFHSVITHCLQEYVEARSFLSYLARGCLISVEDINAEIFATQFDQAEKHLFERNITFNLISLKDYILGIADLSGELMRYCINSAASSERNVPFQIEKFTILLELNGVVHMFDSSFNWNEKSETLSNNLQKIENTCYQIYIRTLELNE
eukprot:jgi/Galph1/4294/GphlegSOOS_G3017.1